MGVINITLCVILVFLTGGYRSNAVQIDIDPANTIATTVNDIHISCLPDGDEDNGKQLTLIELSRNDQDTIVFVSQCGNVSYGHDTSKKFQATGHIDKDPSQSYLNITMVKPESQDTGIYTCIMVYLNTEGHLETEADSGNLLVENLDVKALEGVLHKMKDRIASLEKENKDLNGKVTTMEQENKNLSLDFVTLKDKVSYKSSFMVTNKKSHIKPSKDSVLVLPDIIARTGKGYDEKTGVFTSPVSGLYAFDLVTRSRNVCGLHIELMVNEKLLSKLYAYDKDAWEQSSISSAVDLEAGDRVFCKIVHPCDLHSLQYTVFTGYLIQAF